MPIEIVNVMSFDERNERLYYESFKDEKKEITRREFIKFLTIGSAGLLIPTYTEKEAHAAIPLIYALYIGVFAAGVAIGIEKFSSGSTPIVQGKYENQGKKPKDTVVDVSIERKRDGKVVFNENEIIKDIAPKTIVTANSTTTPIDERNQYMGIINAPANVMRKDFRIV